MQKQQTIYNHMVSIIWLLFLILPNNQLFFIFVPTAYIVLFRFENKGKLEDKIFVIGIVSLLIITLLMNVNMIGVSISIKDIIRLVILAFFFMTFIRLNGTTILKPYIYIAIVYLVFSQFVYILNVAPLKSLFSIYSTEEHEILSYYNDLSSIGDYNFRLGGIFINSNQYARYLELILLVLMCEIEQFNKKSLTILFSVIIFSLVAAGSRTSLIVFCLAVVFYLYSAKVFSPRKTKIIIIVFIALLLFAFLFTGLSEMRAFKISEGMNDSFGAKAGLLMTYLNTNPNIIKILFGNLSPDTVREIANTGSMDWEIGNILLYYGILFFMLLFVFYFYLFKSYRPKYRVVFTILLWMFSSSILSSYRMSALWMLVLGLYYRRSLVEKQKIAT